MNILLGHSNYNDEYQNITSVVAVISLKKMCLNLRRIVLWLCCKINCVFLKVVPSGSWQKDSQRPATILMDHHLPDTFLGNHSAC